MLPLDLHLVPRQEDGDDDDNGDDDDDDDNTPTTGMSMTKVAF